MARSGEHFTFIVRMLDLLQSDDLLLQEDLDGIVALVVQRLDYAKR